MMDTCKALNISKMEYLWEWTIPQLNLARYDSTHVEYSTSNTKQKKGSITRKDLSNADKLNSKQSIEAWINQTGGKC